MNEVGRIDQRLFDALQIRNRGADWRGVLSTSVLPVVVLPLVEPEPTIERSFARGFGVVATVGFNGSIQLRNPTGSLSLVFVDYVNGFTTAAAATQWLLGIHNPDLGGVLRGYERTVRNGTTTARSVALVGAVATGGAGGWANQNPINQVSSPAGGNGFFPELADRPVILYPGSGLVVSNQTANQIANAYFQWRERPLTAGDSF